MAKINIPNFQDLYKEVRDYVRENQGEKGYIDTQNEDCDPIKAIVYDNIYTLNLTEYYVKGIRVNGDDLEIIYDLPNVVYDEDAFKSEDAEWMEICYDDYVYFVPTLFSIAESIEQYIE